MKEVRCFISSPGDVGEERLIAERVVQRLKREFFRRIKLTPILWEHEPLRATAHFQSQIIPPAETDIVICILWSRLGTRLPREFRRPDGTPYASGTEWEFENAAESHRQRGVPDLLVYRKTAEAVARLSSKDAVMQALEQKEALDRFIDRWFGNPSEGFRAAFHMFASADEFERLLETHLRRFLSDRFGSLPVSSLDAPTPTTGYIEHPFRGLSPFDVKHANIFFGRTRAIAELKQQLERQAARGSAFVLVVGMSGSGKSSLVRAGLVPTMTQPGVVEGVGLWRYGIIRPADVAGGPCHSLAVALQQSTALPGLAELGFGLEASAGLMRQNPDLMIGPIRGALKGAAAKVASDEHLMAPPTSRLLIVIDQLEEIFTNPEQTAEERQAFATALASLARSGEVWIVATLRSDFFHHLAELPQMMELKSGEGQYDVLPPTFAELEQMIVQPARVAGVGFEVDVATNTSLNQTIHEAAARNPQALPLLEFTLDELYKRRQDNVLTWAAYGQLGGLEGAIARRAEEVFATLSADVQRTLSTLFYGLVALHEGEGMVAASRRAARNSLPPTPALQNLIDEFVNARLLVVDRDDRGEQTIGWAHEALLRYWPRAAEWIKENQELLRIRSRVTAAAELWDSRERDEDFLLTAAKPLADAETLVREVAGLSGGIIEFVAASSAAATRVVRRRRLRNLLVAAAFVIMATAFSVYSLFQWQRAEHHRRIADDRRQYAESQEELARQREQEAEKRRQEAVEARTQADLARDEARASESRALEAKEMEVRARLEEEAQRKAKETALAQEQRERQEKEQALQQAEFNLKFRNVVLADREWNLNDVAAAKRWLVQTPPQMRNWEWFHVCRKCVEYSGTVDLGLSVTSLHFSPRGSSLIAALAAPRSGEPSAGELSVWDWDAGRRLVKLEGHQSAPRTAILLDRGEQAISASLTEAIRWNVAQAQVEQMWPMSDVVDVALSDNGQFLASIVPYVSELSGNQPGFLLTLRDMSTGEEVEEWICPERYGNCVCVSSDGQLVAAVVDRNRFRVYERGKQEPVLESPAGGDALYRTIFALDISSDNTWLAVGRFDGSVALWSIADRRFDMSLPEHDSAVVDVRFRNTSSGWTIISSGWDKTIRITECGSGQVIRVLRGHEDWIMTLGLSSTGNTLASGGRDGELKLWSLLTDERATEHFPYLGFYVQGAGWSQSERYWFAVVDTNEGPQQVVVDRSNGNRYFSQAAGAEFAATSPDGQTVITAAPGTEDGTLLQWRFAARGMNFVRELVGHNQQALCGVFLDNQRFVSCAEDQTLIVWNVNSGEALQSVELPSVPTAIAYLPTIQTLVVGDRRGQLTRISAANWQAVEAWSVEQPIWALAADPTGARLAVGGGWAREPGYLALWDISAEPRSLTSFAGHSDAVTCLSFHPSGTRLASGGDDMTVRIWDTAAGLEALALGGHRHEITVVAFSPSGRKLLTGSRDGSVIVWDGAPIHLPDSE